VTSLVVAFFLLSCTVGSALASVNEPAAYRPGRLLMIQNCLPYLKIAAAYDDDGAASEATGDRDRAATAYTTAARQYFNCSRNSTNPTADWARFFFLIGQENSLRNQAAAAVNAPFSESNERSRRMHEIEKAMCMEMTGLYLRTNLQSIKKLILSQLTGGLHPDYGNCARIGL
jgi:hypothetical protein